jgi:hypothetical protein
MTTITKDQWNSLDDSNQSQACIKVQEQINRVRRQLERQSLTGSASTLSDVDESFVFADVTSGLGIGSLDVIARVSDGLDSVLLEKLTKILDSRIWLTSDRNLAIDIPESTPSSTKATISDWISFIRNNMDSLNQADQLADRVSFLANEIVLEEGRIINEDSLATFVMFLSSNRITNKPSVGITTAGYVDALWRHSKDSLIEIIFHPGDESQIVTFSHDLINASLINKRAATLPINTIMDVIRSRKLDYLLYDSKNRMFPKAL